MSNNAHARPPRFDESHVGHVMDMPFVEGGPTSTAMKWCETVVNEDGEVWHYDDRFAGVDVGDVIKVLQEGMRGASSLMIMDWRHGDIEFGQAVPSFANLSGRSTRIMTIEDVIARAKALRTSKRKEKTNV
jgi:hypothetical protein